MRPCKSIDAQIFSRWRNLTKGLALATGLLSSGVNLAQETVAAAIDEAFLEFLAGMSGENGQTSDWLDMVELEDESIEIEPVDVESVREQQKNQSGINQPADIKATTESQQQMNSHENRDVIKESENESEAQVKPAAVNYAEFNEAGEG